MLAEAEERRRVPIVDEVRSPFLLNKEPFAVFLDLVQFQP